MQLFMFHYNELSFFMFRWNKTKKHYIIEKPIMETNGLVNMVTKTTNTKLHFFHVDE